MFLVRELGAARPGRQGCLRVITAFGIVGVAFL